MIPVLVASIMNRPDLLDRMLDSVDCEVGRILIIDNGRTGYRAEDITVVTPPFQSMGWAGSLNYAIGQTTDAPWWLYVNNDAWFDPGKLDLLAKTVEDRPLEVQHDKWTVTAITQQVVERVGLLDEWSYFPIYYEDTDYSYRCSLAGVPVVQGDWCHEGDLDGEPQHSMTIRSDPALEQANNRTWAMNRMRYVEKWGGPPGRETFTTPWGRDLPLWVTKPDPWGRQARSW